jgi:biotin synthase
VDGMVRHDWTAGTVLALLRLPLLELIGRANAVRRARFPDDALRRAALLSVKTGGCSEDCAYCAQSARHESVDLTPTRLMDPDSVIAAAEEAKARGADRFCMSAAWSRARDGKPFEAVLAMVRGVTALGLEACVTLGALTPDQARRLAEAGLHTYNHNLDTGPDHYPKIVSTRTYQDRLATLAVARAAGLRLCCGGIVGLGENLADRAAFLATLGALDPHPENVPVNLLVPIPGTPLAARPPPDPLEAVRVIAAARLVLPASDIRLSAGRATLSREAQILCLLAGANGVFLGERLLTAPNAGEEADAALLAALT